MKNKHGSTHLHMEKNNNIKPPFGSSCFYGGFPIKKKKEHHSQSIPTSFGFYKSVIMLQRRCKSNVIVYLWWERQTMTSDAVAGDDNIIGHSVRDL